MICKHLRRFTKVCCFGLLLVSTGHRTLAQEAKVAEGATYRSAIDQLLTVEKVSVLPFTDNLQGIYARPLEAHFISLVDQMHRWDYVPANSSGPILAPEELEASPEKTLQVTQGLAADGVFATRITKGPNGIMIHLSLFLAKDGKLLSQAILKDYKQFDLADLKEQMQRLLSEIVTRLPYSGRVLSREGNRVTINLGLKDGLQKNQVLSAVQIIKANRHPKFNFLISTEKEIVGKIKILKVDQTLSFGNVVTEREKGTVEKSAKLGPLDFITYSGGQSLSLTPSPEEALAQKEGSAISFGKDAKAWQPRSAPIFGQVGGNVNMTRASYNRELTAGTSQSSSDDYAPGVGLEGEIWMTPEWTFHARLNHAFLSLKNSSGTGPAKLNASLTEYEALVGYMFRFGPDSWSAFAEPFLGYFNSKLYVDTVFTTQTHSGFKFGVRGAVPIDQNGVYGVGGEFSMALRSGLKESPDTGGVDSTGVTNFGVFGYKKLSERLKAQVGLDFSMFSANFNRTGQSSSSSQRFTTLSGGVYYMF